MDIEKLLEYKKRAFGGGGLSDLSSEKLKEIKNAADQYVSSFYKEYGLLTKKYEHVKDMESLAKYIYNRSREPFCDQCGSFCESDCDCDHAFSD